MFSFSDKKNKENIWRPRGYVVFVPKECVMLASLSETIKTVRSIFGINKSAVHYPHIGDHDSSTFKEESWALFPLFNFGPSCSFFFFFSFSHGLYKGGHHREKIYFITTVGIIVGL